MLSVAPAAPAAWCNTATRFLSRKAATIQATKSHARGPQWPHLSCLRKRKHPSRVQRFLSRCLFSFRDRTWRARLRPGRARRTPDGLSQCAPCARPRRSAAPERPARRSGPTVALSPRSSSRSQARQRPHSSLVTCPSSLRGLLPAQGPDRRAGRAQRIRKNVRFFSQFAVKQQQKPPSGWVDVAARRQWGARAATGFPKTKIAPATIRVSPAGFRGAGRREGGRAARCRTCRGSRSCRRGSRRGGWCRPSPRPLRLRGRPFPCRRGR